MGSGPGAELFEIRSAGRCGFALDVRPPDRKNRVDNIGGGPAQVGLGYKAALYIDQIVVLFPISKQTPISMQFYRI